jgi:transposase
VTLQIVRDWVLKVNAHGPEGLIDRKPPGQPSRLTDHHRQQLIQMIESGPIPAVHGVVRWRLVDLIQWRWDEHRVPIAKQTLSREVRARLPQAVGPPASSCQERSGGRGF